LASFDRLAGCEKLFEETASGTEAARPQLQACLDYVREGDTLVITRLDRLARSTLHLCQVADLLARKGVHLQVLEQQVDTHTPTGRLLFGMLAVIAQFETELRAERQREGIDKARRAGVHFGRTRALTSAQTDELRSLRAQGVTLSGLMQRFCLGKTAVYRYLAGPDAAADEAPTLGQGKGWCHKHGLQMTQSHKDGRSWWSHKTADGWCKGK
jgi:DNA invertase Pin-like site-specific DNA recombinase